MKLCLNVIVRNFIKEGVITKHPYVNVAISAHIYAIPIGALGKDANVTSVQFWASCNGLAHLPFGILRTLFLGSTWPLRPSTEN